MTPWPVRPIKPPALRRGDRVAVVTPSWGGPGAQPERYALGRRNLEERFGLEVVEYVSPDDAIAVKAAV